jgi:hypothetical protein
MSTPLLRLLLAAMLVAASPSLLHAHEDTLIQLKETTLVGLPDNYSPAELNLKAFRRRIGSHVMRFSPFLKSIVDQPHDLRISASWYHERAILPPYLVLHINPKKKDFSYDVLFNLDTLDVIELSVILQESDSSSRRLPVALSDQDKEDIRKSVETLK